MSDSQNSDSKNIVEIHWDEETIAEHNKLRGTRQKIDEPKTPYHTGYDYHSASSEDELSTINKNNSKVENNVENNVDENKNEKSIDLDLITKKTNLIFEKQQKLDFSTSNEEEEEDKEESLKKKEFANKRKSHYDEFKKMKQFQSKNDDSSSDQSSS